MGEVGAHIQTRGSFSDTPNSFGPDPYLSGEGAFETITGVQSIGVQACAKHLAANNQALAVRALSQRRRQDVARVILIPFLRSIEVDAPFSFVSCARHAELFGVGQAGVSSVMCAYNRVNDTSSCHSANLIGPNGFLRENGFRGQFFVISPP